MAKLTLEEAREQRLQATRIEDIEGSTKRSRVLGHSPIVRLSPPGNAGYLNIQSKQYSERMYDLLGQLPFHPFTGPFHSQRHLRPLILTALAEYVPPHQNTVLPLELDIPTDQSPGCEICWTCHPPSEDHIWHRLGVKLSGMPLELRKAWHTCKGISAGTKQKWLDHYNQSPITEKVSKNAYDEPAKDLLPSTYAKYKLTVPDRVKKMVVSGSSRGIQDEFGRGNQDEMEKIGGGVWELPPVAAQSVMSYPATGATPSTSTSAYASSSGGGACGQTQPQSAFTPAPPATTSAFGAGSGFVPPPSPAFGFGTAPSGGLGVGLAAAANNGLGLGSWPSSASAFGTPAPPVGTPSFSFFSAQPQNTPAATQPRAQPAGFPANSLFQAPVAGPPQHAVTSTITTASGFEQVIQILKTAEAEQQKLKEESDAAVAMRDSMMSLIDEMREHERQKYQKKISDLETALTTAQENERETSKRYDDLNRRYLERIGELDAEDQESPNHAMQM